MTRVAPEYVFGREGQSYSQAWSEIAGLGVPLQFLSRLSVRRVFAGSTPHHGITCLPVLCLVDR